MCLAMALRIASSCLVGLRSVSNMYWYLMLDGLLPAEEAPLLVLPVAVDVAMMARGLGLGLGLELESGADGGGHPDGGDANGGELDLGGTAGPRDGESSPSSGKRREKQRMVRWTKEVR